MGDSRNIEGDLILTALDKQNQYEAVSYTWGSNERSDTIDLNGRKLHITLNLSLILRDLRSQETDRILWIDAICIDQNNNTERGHQVQQMRDIFQNAERVLFCICRPTEMTDILMSCLEVWQNQNFIPSSLEAEWKEVQNGLEIEHFALERRQREGLEYILNQPWFSRAWILQEVANAREALVYCGKRCVSANVFATSPRVIDIRQSESQRYQPVLDLMPGSSRKSAGIHNRDLYSLITTFSTAEATEERDKVYALLGICADSTSNMIKVDYDKSIQEVIRDTVSHICDCDPCFLSEVPYNSIIDFLIDLQSFENMKLLLWAAQNGHEAVVELLLEKGAKTEAKDDYGGTPLWWSAKNGHELAAKVLLKMGANFEAKDNLYSRTPLGCAAANGHDAVVKLLLEKGAEVKAKDKDGGTPLWWAAKNGHELAAKLLINMGADFEVKENSYGRTPLGCAAENGHDAVVKLLLDEGAEIKAKDKYGSTPLWWAAKNGHELAAELLLNMGADCEAKDNLYGRTPLGCAAERGHEGLVKLLVERGADRKAKDNYDLTPVWFATQNGREDILKLLIDNDTSFEGYI